MTELRLVKSVTFNRQDDAAILRKLRRSGKFDNGNWSPFVRDLLRRWAEGASDTATVGGTPATVDVQQAIVQALDERGLDLASIRQTLESTIGSITVATSDLPEAEAPEPEAWFDALLDEGAIL